MAPPRLEVADIFRAYGEAYREQYRSTLSPEQRCVMHAIEICRTAALGGHVDACDQFCTTSPPVFFFNSTVSSSTSHCS